MVYRSSTEVSQQRRDESFTRIHHLHRFYPLRQNSRGYFWDVFGGGTSWENPGNNSGKIFPNRGTTEISRISSTGKGKPTANRSTSPWTLSPPSHWGVTVASLIATQLIQKHLCGVILKLPCWQINSREIFLASLLPPKPPDVDSLHSIMQNYPA